MNNGFPRRCIREWKAGRRREAIYATHHTVGTRFLRVQEQSCREATGREEPPATTIKDDHRREKECIERCTPFA